MKIFSFSLLTSTSEKAQELLAHNTPTPFVVTAAMQSSGQGQRGNTWASPEGGMYLTVVMPSGTIASPADISLVPLHTAVCVAEWIAARFGIRVSIKWPNDVVVAGRKLGGILCSTSVQGEQTGPLLLGIGINAGVTPEPGGEYRAISLGEICGENFKADELCKSFIEYFAAHFKPGTWAALASRYEYYHLGAGQLWRFNDEYFIQKGFGPQGELLLQRGDISGEILSLSSAGQHFSWAYFDAPEGAPPLLIADIGNSQIKLAYFSEAYAPEARECWRLPSGGKDATAARGEYARCLKEVRLLLRTTAGGASSLPRWPIYCSEVNGPSFALWAAEAEAAGFLAVRVAKRPLRMKAEGYALGELGVDRLATIEGWLARLSAEERRENSFRALLVNLGTATTCDMVEADGTHRGGVIVPGLATGLKSLAVNTDLLPAVELRAGVNLGLGNSTVTALQRGALHQALGLISQLRQLPEGETRPCRLVLTGGYASLLASYCPDAEVIEDLTLQGIRQLVLIGGHTP